MNQQKNLIDIIRLIRTPHVTEITFAKLIEKFGNATTAIENLSSIVNYKKKFTKITSVADAEKEIELAKKNNINIIDYTSSLYPPLLKQIENFPPVLFVKGNLSLLKKSALSIVGARNASILGQKNAFKFAKDLGEYGFLVVSGMAKGIDTSAHEGALLKGTLAVLGCGVDVIYPKENKNLYNKILESGVVVSELPIGTPPIPYNFPKRNRIISGISRGVLIIEASLNSGSIITAKLALEQGREVFSMPGNPGDTRSQGANSLIKDGAILTENINDIISVIKNKKIINNNINNNYNLFPSYLKNEQLQDSSSIKSFLMEVLSSSPLSIDIILQHNNNNYSYNQISKVILELELLGKVERHPNNKISLINAI